MSRLFEEPCALVTELQDKGPKVSQMFKLFLKNHSSKFHLVINYLCTHFAGKSSSIGQKQICPPGHWIEMSITKSPRIVQVSVGHEGQHALLLSDDGLVYFVGTSRRGEDGDQTKARRQPKPVKPKKIHRMEGYTIVHVAANNSTSAFVNKEGDLYIFGKDSTHCDYTTGRVSDLKGTIITQVRFFLGFKLILLITFFFSFFLNNKRLPSEKLTLLLSAKKERFTRLE